VLVLRGDDARVERAVVRCHSLAAQHARGRGAPEAQLMLAALPVLRGPAAAPAGRRLAELSGILKLRFPRAFVTMSVAPAAATPLLCSGRLRHVVLPAAARLSDEEVPAYLTAG
jgi:hypothetical protein